MKKTGIFLLAAVMLLPILCFAVSAAPTDATVQSYEQQLADLAARSREVEGRLGMIQADLNNAYQTKAYYDELVNLYIQKRNLGQKQLEAIEQQIAAKEADIAKASADLEKQNAAFHDRMVTLYEEGEVSYLGMILGAKSLSDLLARIEMVLTIQAYDKQVMADLEKNRALLETGRQELERSLRMQKEVQASLEADIHSAQTYADASIALMERLEEDEAALRRQYDAFREAEEKLDAELAAYLASLQERENASYVGGELGWPLPLDAYYRVSSEYGWRVLDGRDDFHYGIDLAAYVNTHIYAANAGTVAISGWHDSYGNYVVVNHGGGLSTLYAHMNERKVSAGEKVSKGQLIGLVGTTGYSKGYHLHFEVRINGKHTEPRDYIVLP